MDMMDSCVEENGLPATPSTPAERTEEMVLSSAQAAGLTNTQGLVQVLRFSSSLNSDELTLLELPGPVSQSLHTGDSVVIRGDPGDDAVLCTKDKTFELRAADTSNMLLLSPSLLLPGQQDFIGSKSGSISNKEVTGSVSSYLELRQMRPRTEKLKQLLSEAPYRGEEFESSTEDSARTAEQPTKYTHEDLLSRVQASVGELDEALKKLQACQIDGYWRVFDPDYRDRVCQFILTLLEEEDWSYRHTPLEPTCAKLEELEPRFAIEHCLNCLGERLTDENGVYYDLSELKVCQFYAELLLRPAGKFNYGEFMSSWQQSVPIGMTTSLDQLEGLALTDMKSLPPAIQHYPVSHLPQDPAARFEQLFSVRERWTHKEIEPYIADFETATQSIKALLLKHTRVSKNSAGEKVYNLKTFKQ